MKTVVNLVSSLKTYFTGKDTAAKQAVEQNIAPVETNATSSSTAYSVGDQLILNDILYDVTASISISNALVVGTNIAPADDLYSQKRTLQTNLTNLGKAAYQTSDSTESSIADADYIPFYDTSASAKKRILKSNLVPSVNSTLSSSSTSPVQNKVVSKALGTVETIGGTATKAYSTGNLMLASTGQLYTVTADIAQGGRITSGGNVGASDNIVSQISNLSNLESIVNRLNGVNNDLATMNLDQILASGSYFQYTDAVATTDKNYPILFGGILVVHSIYVSSQSRYIYVEQTYTTRTNNHSYRRIWDHNTGAFSSWATIY